MPTACNQAALASPMSGKDVKPSSMIGSGLGRFEARIGGHRRFQ
jgi:hypothetical protein